MKALVLAMLIPSVAAAAPQMGAVAQVVAARRAQPPKLAPEENPRLGGAAKAFAKARVRIESPAEREQVPPGDVTVRLAFSGYALVGGAHAHLIVDNDAALHVESGIGGNARLRPDTSRHHDEICWIDCAVVE